MPAEVTIYEDRSFDVRLKAPLTSALRPEAAGIEKVRPRRAASRSAP